MNPEKLAKLQAQVRTGGKGTPRRKVKAAHKPAVKEDKKLASTLKQLNVQPISAIEEVNMFHDDGKITNFVAPRVSASIAGNTFVIAGKSQNKGIEEMFPEILSQLGPESLADLKKLAESFQNQANIGNVDDDIPELVEAEDEAAKGETDLNAAD
ncbi:Nascent polypeptide-associated complex subunit beta [Linderina pennispora]|nr:Nascent polypeptide-associated complex subunit beta [Linderina pennispora]